METSCVSVWKAQSCILCACWCFNVCISWFEIALMLTNGLHICYLQITFWCIWFPCYRSYPLSFLAVRYLSPNSLPFWITWEWQLRVCFKKIKLVSSVSASAISLLLCLFIFQLVNCCCFVSSWVQFKVLEIQIFPILYGGFGFCITFYVIWGWFVILIFCPLCNQALCISCSSQTCLYQWYFI